MKNKIMHILNDLLTELLATLSASRNEEKYLDHQRYFSYGYCCGCASAIRKITNELGINLTVSKEVEDIIKGKGKMNE